MASNKKSGQTGSGGFQKTYVKVADMTPREKSIFVQGCKTVEGKVKKNLGLVPPPKK